MLASFLKQTHGAAGSGPRDGGPRRRWLSAAAWLGGLSVLILFVLAALFVLRPDEQRRKLDAIDAIMRQAQASQMREPDLWRQAEDLTRQELAADPASPDLALRLGVALSMQERYDEAREVFDEAIGRHAADARLAYNRALVEYRAGDLDEALRRLQAVGRDAPYVPHVYYHISLIHEKRGRYDQALEAIKHELNVSSSAAAWERYYVLKRFRGATTTRPDDGIAAPPAEDLLQPVQRLASPAGPGPSSP